MTKNEIRNAVELDELPWWDVIEVPEQDDVDRVAPYAYDSEQRTLVGIGPLGRARRSHPTAAPQPAAAPQSERMPQSEPPGPFIADDEELPAALRGRMLGRRAVATCLVLLVPLAAVGLLRHLSRSGEPPKESARVAAVPGIESPASASAAKSPPVAADEDDQHATQQESQEQARTAPSVERGTNEPAPPSVKLVEVAAVPTVVDRSNGDPNAGTIDLMSTPPSSVVLDGRPLGKSPSNVRAPAGVHTLVFIHPLYGRRSLSITVRPGETTTASTEF